LDLRLVFRGSSVRISAGPQAILRREEKRREEKRREEKRREEKRTEEKRRRR
jgi:hypothetical protein